VAQLPTNILMPPCQRQAAPVRCHSPATSRLPYTLLLHAWKLLLVRSTGDTNAISRRWDAVSSTVRLFGEAGLTTFVVYQAMETSPQWAAASTGGRPSTAHRHLNGKAAAVAHGHLCTAFNLLTG